MAYPSDPIEVRGTNTEGIRMDKAVVRVDNWLLFPDGRTRKLRIKERILLWRGAKLVANLSDLTTRVN